MEAILRSFHSPHQQLEEEQKGFRPPRSTVRLEYRLKTKLIEYKQTLDRRVVDFAKTFGEVWTCLLDLSCSSQKC